MKILLVNVDSKIPNLALEKIRIFYEQKGDNVVMMKDKPAKGLPFIHDYNKIYVSCVFDYNKYLCKKWEGIAEIGGSGYSLKKKLPPKIEEINPKINMGFMTRGCIRNCSFCIVPEKEGKIHAIADIYDIWDQKSRELLLMDNNILALPEHFFKISKQLKKEKLKVDFNQGLDFRLLTDRICKELFSLKYSGSGNIRFAFDHISYAKAVLRALKILRKNGLKDWQTRWYVYVGTHDTVQSVLTRINILRDAKQLIFLMRDKDKKVQNNKEFMKIYIWSSFIAQYIKHSFSEENALYGKQTSKIIDNDKQTLFE